MVNNEYMLTTVDNPHDPFDDFDGWLQFDEQNGYNSNGLLARMVVSSPNFTEKEKQLAIDHAVDDILNLFPGLYKRVYRKNDSGGGSEN